MSLDTRNKRASAIGFALAFRLIAPEPNGSLASRADHAQLAYSYAGVLPVPETTDPIIARPPYFAPQVRREYDGMHVRTQLATISRAIPPILTRTVVADTIIAATDDTILCDTTAGDINVELLPAFQVQFLKVTIKNIGANEVTIDGEVDGADGLTLGTLQSLTIQSDGIAWRRLSSLLDVSLLRGDGSPEGIVSGAVTVQYDQTDATGRVFTWIKRKGADAFGWELDMPPIILPTPTPTYDAYGSSFEGGTGGTVPSENGYVFLLANRLQADVTVTAVGGTGALYTVCQILLGQPVPRESGLVQFACGFNDIRRGGLATKTVNKIKNGHRGALAALFAQTAIAADDPSVTLTGAWVPLAAYSGKATALGGNAMEGVLGDTMSFSVDGDSLILGYITSDNITLFFGSATVEVDGVELATIDCANGADGQADPFNANTTCPGALVLTGLGAGTHTIDITPLDATDPFVLDYIGTLRAPQACVPVLVGLVPRMNALGYATAPANSSDIIAATASAHIIDVVNEFEGYPIGLVFPNTEYDVASGVGPDGIHPNDLGYVQIEQSYLNKVQGGSGAPLDISTSGVAQTSHLGRASTATATAATSYGDGAVATNTNTVAIGRDAAASEVSAIAIGSLAVASGQTATAVGTQASAVGTSASAYGKSSSASNTNDTALGNTAAATGSDNATAVGANSVASSDKTVALGASSTASGSGASALGVLAVASHTKSTAVGKDATTTAANQVMLGTNTETVAVPGGLGCTGPTIGVGYATGAGGVVTQATSKATGVTLSKVCGQITLDSAALNLLTTVSFTWTNTALAATDDPNIKHISGGTMGAYMITCTPAAGSATVYVTNITSGSLSEAIVLGFAIHKAVIS